jgi:hypothetical protein
MELPRRDYIIIVYWCPSLVLRVVAYFPHLVLLPTTAPVTTVPLAVLMLSARTTLYSEQALSDVLMRRGGVFRTEKP